MSNSGSLKAVDVNPLQPDKLEQNNCNPQTVNLVKLTKKKDSGELRTSFFETDEKLVFLYCRFAENNSLLFTHNRF